jgi:hypothetical protein
VTIRGGGGGEWCKEKRERERDGWARVQVPTTPSPSVEGGPMAGGHSMESTGDSSTPRTARRSASTSASNRTTCFAFDSSTSRKAVACALWGAALAPRSELSP